MPVLTSGSNYIILIFQTRSSKLNLVTSTTVNSMTFSTNAKMKDFKLKQCSNIELLPPGGAKRVAITSFPGSGNTWARHLLHMGTGKNASSGVS